MGVESSKPSASVVATPSSARKSATSASQSLWSMQSGRTVRATSTLVSDADGSGKSLQSLRFEPRTDHSGLRFVLGDSVDADESADAAPAARVPLAGDATLVRRLDDVFEAFAAVSPATPCAAELVASSLPGDGELDSMSADDLRMLVRRQRDESARAAAAAELQLHASRRKFEWVSHQIKLLFEQCRNLPAFAENADLDFAAAIGDDPLRFLKSIALTTFRLNRDLIASKELAASLDDQNQVLLAQLDELKLRLVEEFNKVAGVPSPMVYARRAAGRSARRSQSNADQRPPLAAALADAAPAETSKSPAGSGVGRAPAPFVAPTGHAIGELQYNDVKQRVTLAQARVRGWLVRRRMRAVRMRLLVLRELLATEERYVGDLRALVQLYMRPLVDADARGKPIVPREDIRNIFSPIEVMFLYNESFLAELRHLRTMSATPDFAVGKAFLLLGDFMRTYAPYCNNYNVSLAALDRCGRLSAFRALVQRAAALHDCELPSLLIKPVQRLPRYVLLLRQLCDCTPPSHVDSASLAQALQKMQAIASELNEAKREAESFAEVVRVYNSIAPRDRGAIQDLIAPTRRYLKEGRVYYRRDELAANDPHYLFLFNDLLLIALPPVRGLYSVVLLLDLANVTAVQALTDSESVLNCFILDTPQRAIMLLAESAADRDEWVQCMGAALSATSTGARRTVNQQSSEQQS
jgi:hypothetical protein